MKITWKKTDFGFEAAKLPTWKFAGRAGQIAMWIEKRPAY